MTAAMPVSVATLPMGSLDGAGADGSVAGAGVEAGVCASAGATNMSAPTSDSASQSL